MNINERNKIRMELADIYEKQNLGNNIEKLISIMVDGEDGENTHSLEYYIASENMINITMGQIASINSKSCESMMILFSYMLSYVSYKIIKMSEIGKT